ncbi:hypothetical protein L484_012692 [Morus notabilis]|uniref:UBZ4-type domain-containing protein n=1 Tax=Morus notabilis TaxID=981085 RepID=W9S1C7_9ROSA|nr:hypothetical protein L484_012692 [Morus notabilis]
MAVAFEGFSIREYTAKMRSVDVAKCWPFPEELMKIRREEDGEEEAVEEEKTVLPPMSVVKFKWWSHELGRLRSQSGEKSAVADEKSAAAAAAELVCPVCQVFAAATVNAVNAHIDECLVADRAAKADRRIIRNSCNVSNHSNNKASKAKSKPRKKRSIMEIFAVAPQIDAIENASEASEKEEDIEDEEADENENALVDDFKVLMSVSSRSSGPTIKKSKNVMKAKKRKKEKKRVMVEENNSLGVSYKIRESNKKLKKKKKMLNKKKSVDGSIATKRNAQNLKLQNHVNIAKKLKKRFAIDILSSDSVRGKKTTTKCLSTQEKQNVDEPLKLIARNQEPIFPIRSILKNHTSNDQKSTIRNMQRDSEANPCSLQLSEWHVRFSGKDDIFGPMKKDFYSSEQNVGNLLSDRLAASPEKFQSADNRMVAMEVTRSEDDTSVGIDYRTEAHTIIAREQSADIPHVEIPSSPRLPINIQEKTELLREKSTLPQERQFYENNLRRFDQGYASPARRPPFTCLSTLFPPFGGSSGNTQIGGSASSTFNSTGKLINHVQDPIHRVADITPRENISPYSQPLSCFTANETASNRLQFQSQPSEELVNAHTLCCRPFCHLPPMDLIGGLCSFPEWKQKEVVLRESCMDEDFFGLPLNSQGELIQSSSRSKLLFDEPRESNITAHSSSIFPARNLVWPRSTGDYLSVGKKNFEEREFLNDRGNQFLAQNYVKENPSLQVPARTYEQLQNQEISEMIHPKENSGKTSLNTSQPTMRLMGKDVPIGKSSKEMQGFEDGKVWTDTEIAVEHCTSGACLNSSPTKRNFQEWIPQMSGGQYKETVIQSLGIESEKCAQNHLLIKGPGPSFSHPYFDWQTNGAFESSNFGANRNPSSNLFPYAPLPTASRLFSRVPNFQDFFISGAEPVRLGSQLPVLSTPQNSCEHGHWRPAELSHRQNLPHFTDPGFEFPFLNPDSRVNVQSSWFENSKSLPPWLLHAKQQGKTPMISSQQGPIAASKNHQHISSRTNILNRPSIYHSAEACSYPCGPGTLHSQMNSSLGSATIVIPPLGPIISRVKPASAMNTGYRNRMKVKERLKSKAFGVKDLYPCKKTNKRLVTKSLDLVKPTRILNLEKQEKFSALARCSAQNLYSEMQRDIVGDDLHSNRVKDIGLECQRTETQDFGIGIAGNESSRVDIMARSGPIKLSAGAKHILKPNQNMDLDNFMPIHSTIPFAAATNVSMVPESQKKAAKIYRF